MKRFLYSFVCILSALFLCVVPVYADEPVFYSVANNYADVQIQYAGSDRFINEAVVTLTNSNGDVYTLNYGTDVYIGGKHTFTYSLKVPDDTYTVKIEYDGVVCVSENYIVPTSSVLRVLFPDDFEEELPPLPDEPDDPVIDEPDDPGIDFPEGFNTTIFNKIHEDLLIIIVLFSVALGTKTVSIICKNFGGEK